MGKKKCSVYGWSVGLVVKSSCYSRRGPEFKSQHPQGDLQPPITPVSRDPAPSSDLSGHLPEHGAHACIQANMHTHKELSNIFV